MLSAKPTVLRRLAAGLVVGLVGTLGAYVAGASPASAAGINEPPVLPHSVIVFPVRDFVSADGLTVGQNYVIEDWRAGVRVGVSEPITAARPSGLVEVNHPGGGCWTGVTPDIRPGDRVVVHPEADAATGDATTTSNVVVTQPATKDPANPSVVTVKGTAADASGAPLPIGAIEARIVANKQAFVLNGRRTLRAPGDGALAYDAPGSTAWTATFTGLDGVSSVDQLSDADRAVSAGAESRGLWLGINPGTTAEGTIYEFGQIGGPSAPCTAPLATGPSTPDMTAASDTGSSNADNVTNNPTPAFSGVTGNAGATSVNLYVDGTLSGSTATIGAGGTFTVSPDLAIADGAHAVRFGEVVGGVETQSASALQITVDTAAPAAPTVTGTVPAATGSSTAPAVTGTSDAGTTVQVRGDALCTSPVLGSGSAAAFASPGLSATASPGALSTYYAQATDLAGNVSTCSSTSASYRQDSVPPPDPIIDAASTTGLVASTSATFAFSDSEAAVTYQCAVDGAAFAACTSPKAYSALGQGAHSFAVRAVDAAANVSTVATRAWTADTVAPTTDITSPVGTTVNNPAPVFHFTASEAGSTFQCSLDGSPAATCVDGKTYPAAADGPHTFQVTATDQAGNVGPTATYHFTIDTAVPPVTLDGTPPNPTNDNTPTFTYSSPKAGVVFTCAFAPVGTVSPAFQPCPGGTFTSSALTDGTYAFTVRATDTAGNVGSATSQLTIDTAAPAAPTITSKPAVNSAVAQPSFGFTAEPGASFQCSLTPSAAVAAPCGTGEQYGPLADGAYTFKVFAKDAAGNVSLTTSYAFTVDTTAPTATISAGPSGLTKGTSQSFTFSANEAAATKCQLAPVEQTFTACTSPKSYPALADGAYTFQVLATDTAGNVSQAASRSFTVDSTAPVVTLVTKPASLTKDPSPVFSYSSSETATGSCSLVTSGSADLFTPCASTIGYTGKADGTYRFTAKATDAAGNTGTSASYTFTIDTAAPVVTINTQPTSPTNNPSATFGFTTEAGATLFCSLEAQGAAQNFTPCSSPVTYPGLANGTYSFAVQAADAAGNVSTTTPRTFTVDSTAPVVTLTTKPADPTPDSSPVFDYTVDKGTTSCSLVRSNLPDSFAPCGTTHAAYGVHPDGTYRFVVKATDAAGNTGSSAGYPFTIDTVAPLVTLTAQPASSTTSPSVAFGFTSEFNASTSCSLQPANAAPSFAVCSSPVTFGGLADGVYTFAVRATDAAGNTGAPATYTFTKTTAAPPAPPAGPVVPQGTGPAPTGPAPTVSAHVPATGATAVSQTGNLTATFDKPVTGVSTATFTLHAGTAAGPAVGAASVGYDPAARLATFHPAAKLAPGTMYTAVLTSGIRDAAGQALAPTSWAFTTDPRPAVQSKSPSAAAKRVNRKANVTVRFSEKVTGVSTASFTLTTVKGAVVKATVRYNAATRTAVLDPGGPGSFKLKPRTKYTVRVTTRIKDATGNALAPMSWSFTTRA